MMTEWFYSRRHARRGQKPHNGYFAEQLTVRSST